MSDDDLLARASTALRAQTSAPNPRSGLTRARILNSAEKQARAGRSSWLRLSLALASVFVVGTALARFGEYLPVVREVVAALRGEQPEAAETAPSRKLAAKPRPARAAHVEPVEAAEHVEAATAPVVPPAPAPEAAPMPVAQLAPVVHPGRAKVGASARAVAASVPRANAESAELVLFRRAQALHLAHASEALAAWDDYLRVAENGVLVPEAKYNRALCLIRLGRHADARAALEAFARGDFHAYRQREAEALLAALPR